MPGMDNIQVADLVSVEETDDPKFLNRSGIVVATYTDISGQPWATVEVMVLESRTEQAIMVPFSGLSLLVRP